MARQARTLGSETFRLAVFSALLVVAAGQAAGQTEASEITGGVFDQRGHGLAATVVVLETGGEIATDRDGRFRITGLAAGTYSLEARAPGFTVERQEVTLGPGDSSEIELRLTAVPIPLDEIVVTPSRYSILRAEPTSSLELGREEIAALPHLFDEVYRAVTVLPGTAGNDVSGRFTVRGGRHHEVLAQLDGVELYEPFHLKDFQGPQTIIDSTMLGGVDLSTGGFPVEHGDRMAGVLEMTTVKPSSLVTAASLSFTTAQVSNRGTFADGRGSWLASLRRGYLDIVLDFATDGDDDDISPQYWDVMGKITWAPSPRNSLALNLLHADDKLVWKEQDPGELIDVNTGYGSSYAWLRHHGTLGKSMFFETTLAASQVDRDRRFYDVDLPEFTDLDDDRTLDVLGIRQQWNYQPSQRHYLKWGFSARSLDADYDYTNDYVINPVLAQYRDQSPTGSIAFREDFSGEQYGLYLADRIRLGKDFTIELGARYDEQTLLDESQTSPRLNLVWAMSRASAIRVAWGRFFQSQRLYELQVEDGESAFNPAEEAEHRVIGWEHTFERGPTLSIDAYQRLVDNPRPRWESLFDPLSFFSERHPDRALIAPERSQAEGVEVFLRNRGGDRLSWWIHYTWSKVEDEIDGRWTPRNIDQTHALVLDVNWRPRRSWNLNFAWIYHSGWPTTTIDVELQQGQPVAVLGPYYAENISDYHRLDLRASRTWQLRRSTTALFLDVQNVYDRRNPRGLDFEDAEFVALPGGELILIADSEEWLGMIPSFGISWEF